MSTDQPTRHFVEAELAKSPSSTSHKSLLEAYVNVQAAAVGGDDFDAAYFFEANKALVKIYQFLPHAADPDMVATIVLLSMMQYPATTSDRLALSYVIPDRMQKVEPTASVLRCSTLLDECRFVTFWEAYSKLAAMATGSSVPTLQSLLAGTATAALQKSILQTLALTYKSAKLESVLASLNMTSAEALIALKEPCVESVSNGAVTFVGTADNTKRKRVFQEGVSYGAIASMMAKVVASTE
jgi:translation initiation factor 3 subunit K